MTITYVAAAEIARTALKGLAKALIDDDLPFEARSVAIAIENIQNLLDEAHRKLDEEAKKFHSFRPIDASTVVVASSSGHFAARGAMQAGDLDVDYPSRTGASGGSGYQGLGIKD